MYQIEFIKSVSHVLTSERFSVEDIADLKKTSKGENYNSKK